MTMKQLQNKGKSVNICTRVAPELAERLRVAANAQGISQAMLVSQAIENHLNENAGYVLQQVVNQDGRISNQLARKI